VAWSPFKKKEEEPAPKDGEQTKSEVDQLVEKLGASFEERIKPLQEGFKTLKDEWDGIKAAAAKEPEPAPTNADELTEEQKAAKDRTALLTLSVQTNARITESEIISEISGQWAHLIPEIRQYFNSTPIQRKAAADYAEFCRNIKDMVVGKAAQKAGLRFDGKNQRFFLEDANAKSSETNDSMNDPDLSWTDPKSGQTLTFSQQLGKLGIDPKEFAENQKRGIV
jgi:hypothetical protein